MGIPIRTMKGDKYCTSLTVKQNNMYLLWIVFLDTHSNLFNPLYCLKQILSS